MSETPAVSFVEASGLRVLTLQRPERANALSSTMADTIRAHLEDYAKAGGGSLTIESTGRTFCAGVDLADAPEPGQGGAWVLKLLRMQYAIALHPGAIVAAVQGPAIGSGAEICVAADVVIATPAAIFAFPEAKIGSPAGISSTRLARTVGASRAREILLSGRRVSADEAAAIGLVHKIVDHEVLADEARAVARQLAVPDSAVAGWVKRQIEGDLPDLEALAEELGSGVDGAFAAAASRAGNHRSA
jgi:enoyl-CoA hydratase/carnithine racemase